MAIRGGDGSIILTTTVDTDGIKKGLATTETAVTKTSQKIEHLGKVVEKALEAGDTKAAQLANNYKKATQEVEKQSAKINALKDKLDQLENGQLKIESKDILRLQNELTKTTESIRKLEAEADSLYTRSGELQSDAFKAPGTNEPVLTPSEQAQLDEINARLDEIEPKLEANKKKALELGAALKSAMGAETQSEIEKTTKELDTAEKKLGDLTTKAQMAKTKFEGSLSSTQKAAKRVGNTFDSAGKRLWRLAKGALIFSTITKAFTILRENIGAALLSNESFRRSVQQLQAAMWTVSEPLYQAVLPALQMLVKWLTIGLLYISTFFAALSGKTIQQTLENAKALNKEADAMKNLAQNTKDAKKQLASFDELSILSRNAVDTPILDVQAGFDDLEDLLNDGDMDNLIEFQNWVLNNKDTIKNALEIAGVLALGAGIVRLIGNIGDLLGIFKKKDKSLDIQTNKTQLESQAVGELAGAFSVATLLAGAFVPKLKNLTDAGLETIPTIDGATSALDYMSSELDVTTESAISLSPALDTVTESALDLSPTLDKVSESALNLSPAMQGATLTSLLLPPVMDTATQSANMLAPSIDNVTESARVLPSALDPALDSIEDFANISSNEFSGWSRDVTSEVGDVMESIIELRELLGEEDIEIKDVELSSYKVSPTADMLPDREMKPSHSAQHQTNELLDGTNKVVKKVAVDLIEFKNVIDRVMDAINDWGEAIANSVKKQGSSGAIFPAFSMVPVPLLAQGTVLPGGKPYYAIVNDQPAGQINIEAPLQTIVDAFNIALAQNGNVGGGSTEVVLEVDGREFGRAVIEQGNKESRRVGTRLVIA